MINANAHNTMSPQPPAGAHDARVVGVVDLGHQPGYEWQGDHVASCYKVELTYELVNTLMTDGRPFWVSETMNLKNVEKATLFERLQALDPSGAITGNGNNLESLIGVMAMVNVGRNKKDYAKINNVMGLPVTNQLPELVNDPMIFSTDQPSAEQYNRMGKLSKRKIADMLDKPEALVAMLSELDEF